VDAGRLYIFVSNKLPATVLDSQL